MGSQFPSEGDRALELDGGDGCTRCERADATVCTV